MTTHLFIPDTQAKDGVPTAHLDWIGEYIAEKQPDRVIHIGDHWDMPSLSSYDQGKKQMEGRRYRIDVAAGNEAMGRLRAPVLRTNAHQRANKHKLYSPEWDFFMGNHEHRITRAVELDAKLDGTIGLDDLDLAGWTVHPFLEPENIDGVMYAHYFYQPMSGRPFSGTIDNRLKQVGHTFSMGHQQTLLYGIRYVLDRSQHGLVAGSCYLHDEDYKGPQGNHHWRGIVMKYHVEGGSYDPKFVSLKSLCLRYEGVTLAEFMSKQ